MSPFIQGGEVNGGFEYLGLDFILSHKQQENGDHPKPVAYLLEVNAPHHKTLPLDLPMQKIYIMMY